MSFSQDRGPKGSFSKRISAPPAKLPALPDVPKRTGLQEIAAAKGVPVTWMESLQYGPNMKWPEKMLSFCEAAPPKGQPIINGRPASPDVLANFISIAVTAIDGSQRSLIKAQERTTDQNELLVTDLMVAGHLFDTFAISWQSRLRMRIHAELVRDRINRVGGKAEPTPEWMLRGTLVAAVKAKALALGNSHGDGAEARKAVIDELSKHSGFDFSEAFPSRQHNGTSTPDELKRQCRLLADWQALFEDEDAHPGAPGLRGADGAAIKHFAHLASQINEADATDVYQEFCEFAVWQQKLGRLYR